MTEPRHIYLFVVWSTGAELRDRIESEIARDFKILKRFDVVWPPRNFINNFAAFYGWKGPFIWWKKKRRSGTGPFRMIVVEDTAPEFDPKYLHEEPKYWMNLRMLAAKSRFRKMSKLTNIAHSAVNEDETRHNLRAITGETLEEFLSRDDLDGSVEKIEQTEKLPFRPSVRLQFRNRKVRLIDYLHDGYRWDLYLLPECGVSTVFSFRFRIFGILSVGFCLGKVKW